MRAKAAAPSGAGERRPRRLNRRENPSTHGSLAYPRPTGKRLDTGRLCAELGVIRAHELPEADHGPQKVRVGEELVVEKVLALTFVEDDGGSRGRREPALPR